jgi:hypothetical protein
VSGNPHDVTRVVIGLLVLSTAISAPVATAQELRRTSFATSIEHEVARLARSDSGPVRQAPGDDAWLRVRQLRPGIDISIVMAGRGQASPRTLLRADESTLTLLNADAGGLPHDAAAVLHRVSAAHPAWFLRSGIGERIELDNTLTFTADGLYAGNRKLADRSALIEVVAQPEVDAVSVFERKGNAGAGTVGGILGGLVGFGIGYSMVAGNGREGQYWPLFSGPAIGAVAGAFTVSHLTSRRMAVVVYRRQ